MNQQTDKTQNTQSKLRPGSAYHRQKGVALITSMLVMWLLTVLGITTLRMSGLQEKMSGNLKLLTSAEFAAERGISEAISNLLNSSINDSGAQTSTTWNATGAASGTGYNTAYTVQHRIIDGAVAVDADGLPYYQINSTGTSGKASLDLEVVVNLTYTSLFDTGLIGCRGVHFNSDSITSSYSSSGASADGDKGDITTTDAGADITLNSNTDILGNVYAVGELSMESNAKIQRDAYANEEIYIESPGSDSYIRQDAWSQDSITSGDGLGTNHPNQAAVQVPIQPCDPLGIDAEFAANAIPIKTSNDNAELNPSYYSNGSKDYFISSSDTDTIGTAGQTKKFFFDDFQMDSDSIVTLQGNITFYVEDYFDLESKAQLVFAAGASLTVYVSGMFEMDSDTKANAQGGGGAPANFSVFSDAETTTYNSGNVDSGTSSPSDSAMVFLGSNVYFYGTVYAPRAHVLDTSNAESRGAMRGRWIEFDSNGEFQYDEDLENGAGGAPTDYNLVYWTQQSFTN